jgi:hypothetical protein
MNTDLRGAKMDYRTLRSRIVQHLSTGTRSLDDLVKRLTDDSDLCIKDAPQFLKPEVGSQVNQIVHEMLRCGMLAPDFRWDRIISGYQSHDKIPLQVTDYGRRLLSGDRDAVWDPTGFLADLRSAVRGLHQLELTYLEESVRAYHLCLYRASAVMLGAASEALLVRIITATCPFLPNGDAINRKLDTNVSTAFDAWRKALDQCPLRPKSELLRAVDNAFELIRLSRNEAAHPKKVDVDRLELEVMLVGFKRYVRALLTLRNQIRKP